MVNRICLSRYVRLLGKRTKSSNLLNNRNTVVQSRPILSSFTVTSPPHLISVNFQNVREKHTNRRRRRATSALPATAPSDTATDTEGGRSEATPMKHTPLRKKMLFSIEADLFLDKLEKALEPMKKCNESFNIVRIYHDNDDSDRRRQGNSPEQQSINDDDTNPLFSNELKIHLNPADGVYSIAVDEESMTIFFTSPISGGHAYILSVETGEWVGTEDGHSLEGLLVRDLIRQCNGVPKL